MPMCKLASAMAATRVTMPSATVVVMHSVDRFKAPGGPGTGYTHVVLMLGRLTAWWIETCCCSVCASIYCSVCASIYLSALQFGFP